MSLPAGYASRPATRDDLEAIVALFDACDRADVGFEDPVREHLEEDWRAPAFELSTSSLLVLAEDGMLVAYAHVSGHNPELSLDGYGRVNPDHRRRGLGTTLVDWIERRASADAPPKLFNAILSTDEAARDLLSHRGYARARTFFHMEIDPAQGVASSPPEGIEMRTYRHDADVRPVYDALEEAFQDHWGHEPYPFDLHVEQMSRVDPRLALVATEGDEVVGAAAGRALEGVGWIDVVGVRRPWRGRGIARALLSHSFEGFSGLETTSVRLSVDAESLTGATRLYESVGMRVRRGFDLFEKRLGKSLPTNGMALPADIS